MSGADDGRVRPPLSARFHAAARTVAADAPAAAPARPKGPTREDVRYCYRLILGREPEDEAVLDRHLVQAPTLKALRARFINSEEFRSRNTLPMLPPLPLAPERLEVEHEATPAMLAAMLERAGRYWRRIGQEAPHWSVLTQDRFRPDSIEQSLAAFYETGAVDRDLVRSLLARHRIVPPPRSLCVEYGCGVGRATLRLAELFGTVVGCDISPPHLQLAQQEAASRGVGNIAWHESTVATPMPAGPWHAWYSRLVLQHNPPPVIAHLLRLAFRGLAPGGVAIFQVPTHNLGYRFSVADYLASEAEPTMEVHVLPQRAVFALAAEAGLEVLDIREDTHVVAGSNAVWLSNLFLLQRPG